MLATPSSTSTPPLRSIGSDFAPETSALSGVPSSAAGALGVLGASSDVAMKDGGSASSWTWNGAEAGELGPSCETPTNHPSNGSTADAPLYWRQRHSSDTSELSAAVAAAAAALSGGAAFSGNGGAGASNHDLSASFALPVVETDRAVHRKSRKGKPVINDYVVDVEIGQGKYSTVRLVTHAKTKRPFAMKIIKRSCLAHLQLVSDPTDRASSERFYRHEIAVLKRLRHPHIIALVEVIDAPIENCLYLILELAEEGPIARVDRRNGATVDESGMPLRLDEATAAGVAKSLIGAIRYAHHNGVAHRDIKPENILRTATGELKLADFGVAKMIDDWPTLQGEARDLMLDPMQSANVDHPLLDDPHSPTGRKVPSHETQGTPWFMSPESVAAAVRGVPEGVALDLSDLFLSDIWSFGVTMYALTVGCLPWTAGSHREMAKAFDASKGEELPFPPGVAAELSDGLRDFLAAAIRINPTERLSLRQLAHHPWITTGGGSGANNTSWPAAAMAGSRVPLAQGYSFTPSFPTAATSPPAAASASFFNNFSFDYAGLATHASVLDSNGAPPLGHTASHLRAPSTSSANHRRGGALLSPEEATSDASRSAAAGRRNSRDRATALTDSFAGDTVRLGDEDLQEALASMQEAAMSVSTELIHLVGPSSDDSPSALPTPGGAYNRSGPLHCDALEDPAAAHHHHHHSDNTNAAHGAEGGDGGSGSGVSSPAPLLHLDATGFTSRDVTPPAALSARGGVCGSVDGGVLSVLSPHAMSLTQVYESSGVQSPMA